MAIALFDSIRNDDWSKNIAALTYEQALASFTNPSILSEPIVQWRTELKRWEVNPEKLWPEYCDRYFFTLKARVILYQQLKSSQTDYRKEKSFVEYFEPPTTSIPEISAFAHRQAIDLLTSDTFYATMADIIQDNDLPEEIRVHTKGFLPYMMPQYVVKILTPKERGIINTVFLRTLATCIQKEYDSIFNTQPKMELQTKIEPLLDQKWNASYMEYGLAMSYSFIRRETNEQSNATLSLTTTFSPMADDSFFLIRRETKS